MTQAVEIIRDAYERCNRLSPGETLSADDADFGFRRLALIVDYLSAKKNFLFRDVTTTVTQTGNITLGSGSWAAVPVGAEIIGMWCNDVPLSELTIQQYNAMAASSGLPGYFAHDGNATVYLYPLPTAATIKMQTRVSVSAFADQTTEYTLTPGYKNALGAILAAKIAPNIIGQLPATLDMEERKALASVETFEPAILDVISFNGAAITGSIQNGW